MPPKQAHRTAYGEALLLLVLFWAIGGIFGVLSGLLEFAPSAVGLWRLALVAVILPALAEELIFRGPLLLTPPRWRGRVAVVSFFLFIVWHPLNGFFFLTPAQDVFFDPRFWVLAAGLGLATTLSVLRSGRLLPAVLIHWLSVVAWKGFMGGPDFMGVSG